MRIINPFSLFRFDLRDVWHLLCICGCLVSMQAATANLHAADLDQKVVTPAPGSIVLRNVTTSGLNSIPIAMTWDVHGQIWLLEREGFDPKATTRLLVLSDADGNANRFETRVFAEHLPSASGFEVDAQNVWLAAPPGFYSIPIGTDGRAGPLNVLFDGFGTSARPASLTDFHWGWDGWLYALLDSHDRCQVLAKGSAPGGADLHPFNPGVLRFHPRRKEWEAFSEGPLHPRGLAKASQGDWVVTSGSRESLGSVVHGGRYLPATFYPRPTTPSAMFLSWTEIPQLDRFTAGPVLSMTLEEKQSLGWESASSAVWVWATNGLWSKRVAFSASAYSDSPKLGQGLQEVGALLRSPHALSRGPDLAIWVRHGTELTRVLTLPSQESVLAAHYSQALKLSHEGDRQCLQALTHSNAWIRWTAFRLLSQQPKAEWASDLIPMVASKSHQLGSEEALWLLFQMTTSDTTWLQAALRSGDFNLRIGAVKVLAERNGPSPESWAVLRSMLLNADERVLRGLALTARRWVLGGRMLEIKISPRETLAGVSQTLEELIQATAADRDHVASAALWDILDLYLPQAPLDVLEFLRKVGDRGAPLSHEFMTRSVERIFAIRSWSVVDQTLDFLAKIADESPRLCAAGLEGMMQGQRDSKIWTTHHGLRQLLSKLSQNPDRDLARSAQQVDAYCGNLSAQTAILSTIADSQAPEVERIRAVRFARLVPSDAGRRALFGVVSNEPSSNLRMASIEALGWIGTADDGGRLAKLTPRLPIELRAQALERLSTRSDWMPALLEELEQHRVQASELSEAAVHRLKEHPNPRLRARAMAALSESEKKSR